MVDIAIMAENHIMATMKEQMARFKASDEARDALMLDVLQKYEGLLRDNANLKRDYESEMDIRRHYQTEKATKVLELSALQTQMDNSSFVLALIDGDGVIFQDSFLRHAANGGGSEAASNLQAAVREHITSIYPNCSHWPIMVHIYVSLDKLAQKMVQVGLLKQTQEFRTFAQAFTVNQPLFSIIDVGHGKERADHMIKEMLRSFSDNPTCKHIIFGGCHDAGYLLNLDQYKHNATKASRITLLESTPAHRGYADLPNFRRARFDTVFKSDPLDAHGQNSAQVQTTTQPAFPAPLRTMSSRTVSPVTASPKQANVKPKTNTSITNNTIKSPSVASTDSSWATVGKTGPPSSTISIAPNPKTTSKKKYIYYNKNNERLDEPLPPRDPAATEAIERRMNQAGRNLCNHYHLNFGNCNNGDFCHFQHAPKLTTAENIALRYKTRSLPCKNRQCENFECYLGHQCANERDKGFCRYEDCHLKASHGMDRTKYVRWDEDWNEEYTA